ncbi:unnamed protein product, partial [Owenia fusiformis]
MFRRASPWHYKYALDECGASHVQISCVDTLMRPRLVGGQSNSTGLLEVWYKKTWKKVCIVKYKNSLYPSSKDVAEAACYSLGYKYSKVGAHGSFDQKREQGRTKGISLECSFNFEGLHRCSVTEAYCHDYKMYFISCFDQQPELTDFVDIKDQVRFYFWHDYHSNAGVLVINSEHIETHYKIYYDQFFICGTGWGINEARVACRHLGYDPKNAAADTFSKYTCYAYEPDAQNKTPSTAIYMSDVVCSGDEYNLADCSFNYGDNASCPDGTRASVICDEVSVRLRSGKTAKSGIVEIRIGRMWWRICSSTWDVNEAKVICQQLGLPYGNVSTYERKFRKDDWSFI